MKNQNPTITLLGSNSGNNVGDAAILSAILEAVTKRMPGSEFLVPTTNPDFINKEYGSKYKVKAVDIMPWNLSFRFLGLPSFKCLWKSDVALICDGIIFGKRFYNPAFNLLITLAPLAFFGWLFNCKFVCYSVGIGPFPKGTGSSFAKWLIQSCELIMMREEESKKLAERIGVTKPIELTGDAAFINPVSSKERALEIIKLEGIDSSKPFLGINITKYADSWMKDSEEKSDTNSLVSCIAQGIKNSIKMCASEFNPLVFSTHPMDMEVAKILAQELGCKVVSSNTYLSHDLQSVMNLCDLFIGMRFHSLVLSSAVGVPIVGLVYAPKVRGLMQDLGCTEYSIEMAGLQSDTISKCLQNAWQSRQELRTKQQKVVSKFKLGAERAADLLVEKFYPEFVNKEQTNKLSVNE